MFPYRVFSKMIATTARSGSIRFAQYRYFANTRTIIRFDSDTPGPPPPPPPSSSPPPSSPPSPSISHPSFPTVTFGGNETGEEHFSIVKHNLDSLTGVKDKADDIFAVFKVSGTQIKATLDDIIITHKIKDESGDLKVGTTIEFEDILLIGTKTQTIIGRPVVPRAKVIATVEEQTRDKKIIVFKKKKRKGYKRKHGHRSYITSMRILDIVMDDSMRV